MSTDVYIARSRPWLRQRLLERAELDPGFGLADSVAAADLVLYPVPDWSDPAEGDAWRRLGRRARQRAFLYSQSDFPVPWAPGVYASLPASRAGGAFAGGFYVAHHHREEGGIGADLEAARRLEPDLLWSFVGTGTNHAVRRRLLELHDPRALVEDTRTWSEEVRWAWAGERRADGRAAFSGFASSLGRSKFVLCPRGRGASSIRLFEAMQVGRCPVIVSDEWLPPPFVDWGSCSLRVPEAAVAELPALLRGREGEAEELGREARRVWERLYFPERQLQTLIDACLALAASSPPRPAVLARALLHPDAMRQGFRGAKRRVSG
jgi:Exostosin family